MRSNNVDFKKKEKKKMLLNFEKMINTALLGNLHKMW